MAELSPAAQAVLDAAREAWITKDDPRSIAAAALRAVADQRQVQWNYHPDYPETELVIVASDLLALVTELENHQ